MKLSTLSAAFTSLITLASAHPLETRTVSYATFTLTGFLDTSTGITPSYTIAVPRDGSVVEIHDPLVVVTIAPDGDDDYNCTFVGAEGYVTHLGPVQDVDGPQAQVSVTCAAVE